jgi:hypothetical protein
MADYVSSKPMTIAAFCEKYDFTRQHFWEMDKRGEAPDKLRVGKRGIRITPDAEARWVERRTVKSIPREGSPAA